VGFSWPGNCLVFEKERNTWSAHSPTARAGASYRTTSTTPSASSVTPITSTTRTGDGKEREGQPDGVQQGQGQGPAPGQEQPQAPVQAGAELLESSSVERDWECWGMTG